MSTVAGTRRGTPASPSGDGALSHRQILTILSGLMLGMFLAALDQTIVASAIRVISDDLHGLSLQAWATTAYLITATISTPLYGKLSDIYGRKPFFLTSISIFVVGSALSAFSTSMYELAAFRALQGLGAGGLFSLALAIIGDIVPPRERAKYQGYFLAVFGTSSVLGPVIGGFFAGASSILGVTGWRWVFLVNVPIGIVALIVVQRVLNLPHHRHDHRIDWQGAVALVIALVPLLTVAEQGREWGWGSGRAVGCYVVGLIGTLAFYLAERRAGDEALLPLRLFQSKTFSVGSLLGVVIGVGMFGFIAALPLYLQIVKGASPTQAGLQLLPLTLGIMMGSIVSGQAIARTGRYRIFPILGAALMLAGVLLLHGIGVDTAMWQVMAYMVIFGLGLGFNMQPLVLALQNAVPPRDMGVATASATFFRQMGGTLGTAVFLSVLFSTVGDRIRTAFESAAATPAFQQAVHDPALLANPANRAFVQGLSQAKTGGGAISGALSDSSFINHLDPRLAHPFLVGFSQSIQLVLLLAAIVILVGLALTFLLPEVPLRTMSGLQAAQADREAAERDAAERDAAARAAGTSPLSPPVNAEAMEVGGEA